MTPKSGRVIAWLSFLLGIGVSIAGNIGHAASDGMKPGEWAGAAFWPLALMLTIEILTRVRWQVGWNWTTAKVAALFLVAVVAAVLSYRHLAGLMTYWGEDWANAHLGPLAVDGLMLIAATALLSISKERPVPVIVVDDNDQNAEILKLVDTLQKQPIETSKTVPPSASVEHAKQIWLSSDPKPSVRRLAELSGLSASKAHRVIGSLKDQTA